MSALEDDDSLLIHPRACPALDILGLDTFEVRAHNDLPRWRRSLRRWWQGQHPITLQRI